MQATTPRSEPTDDGAARGLKDLLLAMPDVGEDEDFARHDDAPREVDPSFEE
jgi:hypothetical protein